MSNPDRLIHLLNSMNASLEQVEAVRFYQGYNVPATWAVAPRSDDGAIDVFAVGDGFVWSIKIERDGSQSTSEATVGPFETGIEV